MTLNEFFTRLVPASGLAFILALSLAQAQREPDYQPSVGQEGKDVVWVPTSQALVDKMLDTAKLTPNDYHVDLGSGDGRTVITAAKRGSRSLGIEYNPDMVELSKRNAAKEGVADKATFMKADLFETDFSKADVLTLFLLPNINVRLRPKILEMKPGTRVVSNSFDMGDWQPDERVTVTEGCTNYCNALFWIVPANVQGKWKMPNGELTLEQKYQVLTGTARLDNNARTITGKMTGPQIAFTVGDTSYTGRVNGNTMEGTSKSPSGETKWTATRAD
jgi:hypothetical protein